MGDAHFAYYLTHFKKSVENLVSSKSILYIYIVNDIIANDH